MTVRELAKPKSSDSATPSPVFSRKPSGKSFYHGSINEDRTVSNSGFGHNFGDVQVVSPSFKQSCTPMIQTKLKIGQPNDKYEQEADRVAEQVMRMPDSKAPREAVNFGLAHTGPVPSMLHEVLSSPSQRLSSETRSFMEQRFGHDFCQVKIHTGPSAEESAKSMHARAFTLGRDVVFGGAQFNPETTFGRRLLAHELTHVIQQGSATERPLSASSDNTGPHGKSGSTIRRQVTQLATCSPHIQRQPGSGGPYHPPAGVEMRCTSADTCPALSQKINYLKHTIKRHVEWDAAHPNPVYPGGRHAQEISELTNALNNCIAHHQSRCTNQPEYHPVPEQETERVTDEAARRVAVAASIGAGLGLVLGAIVGGVGGGVGGTLVAPGVGTVGGAVGGGALGAAEGAAIGGLAGGAILGAAQAFWEWVND